MFDTSVLVAGLIVAHPEHDRSHGWLRRAASGSIDACVAAHALSECYAVLTTLPARPRISPAAALRLIAEGVEAHARVVALSAAETQAVIRRCAELELAGGIVHDALIARAAVKAGVDRLVTLNRSDFQRAWPEGRSKVVEP